MKRVYTFTVIITVCCLGAVSLFSGTDKFKDAVNKQKMSDKQRVEEARKKVELIQKDIKERNLKFRVDITEAIKYEISEITGADIPSDIEKTAVKESEEGEKNFKKGLHSKSKKKKLMMKKVKSSEGGLFSDFFGSSDEWEYIFSWGDESDLSDENSGWEEYSWDSDNKTDDDKTGGDQVIDDRASDDKSDDAAEEEKITDDQIYENFRLDPVADPKAKSFSWLSLNKLTPIKYQAQCGSCWAFTAMGVFESCWLITNNRVLDLSEQDVVSCSGGGSCDGGWYSQVFEYYRANDAIDEKVFPYAASNKQCIKKKGVSARVSSWGWVMGREWSGYTTVDKMKEAICKYGPIAACVKVTPAFQAYAGGIFDEHAKVSGPEDMNHAIVLVGWDDSKKSWLLRNSWGTGWGENGYMWIEYDCNNVGVYAVWMSVVPQ